jgi:glucuronate isomerase
MIPDNLTFNLFAEICQIPIIDPHSHIDPRQPASRTLEDILGYHYYTELAHSTGMSKALLADDVEPRDRVRHILYHMGFFDNTAQYQWFLDIAQTFLGFEKPHIDLADCTWLCDAAERLFRQPDWDLQVLRKSNIEKVFLTNHFDDPLTGFDSTRYVPCLRTDDLVFHLVQPDIRERLHRTTGIDIGDGQDKPLRRALAALFQRFKSRGARACAVSLPPNFTPAPVPAAELVRAFGSGDSSELARGVFWMLAELCRDFGLPFDLMIGVNRGVYRGGVFQGQDLFDQRTSLIQYAELFNAFPSVTFCVSVLSSTQNQELASYAWIFPNVVTSGHWWYSNIPACIEHDIRTRLHAVPKTKQIGYYSDMYKLEFGLPKYNMYRRILAQVLADDFIRSGVYTERQALEIARLLLRDNARRIFDV